MSKQPLIVLPILVAALFLTTTPVVSAQSAKTFYNNAVAAMEIADYDLAIDQLDQARRGLGRTNPKIEGLLAQVHLGNNQVVEAKIALEKYKRMTRRTAGSDPFIRDLEKKINQALEQAEKQFADDLKKQEQDRMRVADEVVSSAETKREKKRQSNNSADKFYQLARKSNDLAALTEFAETFAGSGNVAKANQQIKQIKRKIAQDRKIAREFYEQARKDSDYWRAVKYSPYFHEGKWGLIDSSGRPVLEFEYAGIGVFGSGAFYMAIKDKEKSWRFYDRDGRVIESYGYPTRSAVSISNAPDAPLSKLRREQWNTGIKMVPPPRYVNELMMVEVEGKWGALNKDFELCIPAKYDMLVTHDQESFVWAKRDGKAGLLSFTGEVLMPFIYDEIQYSDRFNPRNKSYRIGAKLDGKWYRVDAAGNKYENEYDRQRWSRYGVVIVTSIGRYGLIEPDGKLILPTEYQKLEFLGPQRLIATKAGNKGVIDFSGKILVPIEYEEIKPFYPGYEEDWAEKNGGLFKVKKDDLWGVMDETGRIVIQVEYKSIADGDRSDWVKLVAAEVNSHGWFNRVTGVSIPAKYREAKFSKNLIFVRYDDPVSKQSKWGWYDYAGNLVQSPQYQYLKDFGLRGMFSTGLKKEGERGLRIALGTAVSEQTFDLIVPSSPNLWMFKRGRYYGFIDDTGVIITPPSIASIRDLGFNMSKYWKEGKVGLINRETREVYPAVYEEISDFKGDRASVRMNGQNGYINKQNDYSGPSLAQLNGKWGVIDEKGAWIVPARYEFIGSEVNGLRPIQLGDSWSVFDSSYTPTFKFKKYDSMAHAGNGYFHVERGGRFGVISTEGKALTKLEYERVGPFKNGRAAVKQHGKYGFIDTRGKVVVPIKYEAVDNWGGDRGVGKLNGTTGFIEPDGSLKQADFGGMERFDSDYPSFSRF